jgi:hypothetical protein
VNVFEICLDPKVISTCLHLNIRKMDDYKAQAVDADTIKVIRFSAWSSSLIKPESPFGLMPPISKCRAQSSMESTYLAHHFGASSRSKCAVAATSSDKPGLGRCIPELLVAGSSETVAWPGDCHRNPAMKSSGSMLFSGRSPGGSAARSPVSQVVL